MNNSDSFILRTDSSREGPFCTALFEEGLLFGCYQYQLYMIHI